MTTGQQWVLGLFSLLLISCAGSSSGYEVTLLGAQGFDPVGVWHLTRDDDAPNTPKDETLQLYPDHRFAVQGAKPFKGSWEANGGTLILTVAINGKEIQAPRPFQIDGNAMRLANKGGGFAHYEKVGSDLPELNWIADWSEQEFLGLTFKLPVGWRFTPHANGVMAEAANGDGSKSIFLMVGSMEDPVDVGLRFVERLAANTGNPARWLEQDAENPSIRRGVFDSTKQKFELRTWGQPEGAAVIFSIWKVDSLQELPGVLATMTVEDEPLFPAGP